MLGNGVGIMGFAAGSRVCAPSRKHRPGGGAGQVAWGSSRPGLRRLRLFWVAASTPRVWRWLAGRARARMRWRPQGQRRLCRQPRQVGQHIYLAPRGARAASRAPVMLLFDILWSGGRGARSALTPNRLGHRTPYATSRSAIPSLWKDSAQRSCASCYLALDPFCWFRGRVCAS